MPITFSCLACGKSHSVRDDLAGKTGKCGCGSPVQIPSAATAGHAPPPPAPLLGAPMAQPAPQPTQSVPPAGTAVGPSFAPVVASSASVSNAWMAQQGVPQPKPKKKEVLRYVVAGSAILYSLFNPLLAFLMYRATQLPTPPVIFGYTPIILVGAVLIIMNNRWGPSVVALAMLFGGFIQGWVMIGVGVTRLVETGSAGLIVGTLIMYIIPAAIFIWCVREEKRRPVSQG